MSPLSLPSSNGKTISSALAGTAANGMRWSVSGDLQSWIDQARERFAQIEYRTREEVLLEEQRTNSGQYAVKK